MSGGGISELIALFIRFFEFLVSILTGNAPAPKPPAESHNGEVVEYAKPKDPNYKTLAIVPDDPFKKNK
ncbi:unnamed protein product [Bursaphelenchus okinawaensis]|uniref:Uncharacterized protein n=1 Tax=Bursaphelenchus okinawaensis TaxID=465554 RepID=A0A811LP07_9BILA|nr:unnamed protein product [Bursaphelenchus okinawaensis]CAG9124728.1 unnamed protein product [Bursaphelenchus okinawaensis]